MKLPNPLVNLQFLCWLIWYSYYSSSVINPWILLNCFLKVYSQTGSYIHVQPRENSNFSRFNAKKIQSNNPEKIQSNQTREFCNLLLRAGGRKLMCKTNLSSPMLRGNEHLFMIEWGYLLLTTIWLERRIQKTNQPDLGRTACFCGSNSFVNFWFSNLNSFPAFSFSATKVIEDIFCLFSKKGGVCVWNFGLVKGFEEREEKWMKKWMK